MRILYMNQGGGGNWGAIRYSDYDLLLLAESSGNEAQRTKDGFSETWYNPTPPPMSIQEKDDGSRLRKIINAEDLDVTQKEVRPIVTFITRDGIRVVFVHLKSASVDKATAALNFAVNRLANETRPILWIGDFNRANDEFLRNTLRLVFSGGGVSEWNLDRAYISGNWDRILYGSTNQKNPIAISGDNLHAAIEFEYSLR